MNRFLLVGLFLVHSIFLFAQINEADLKKITKILEGTVRIVTNNSIESNDSISISGYYNRKVYKDFNASNLLTNFISLGPVMLDEYQAFMQHVVDSVLRKKIYLCLEDDNEATEFLNLENSDQNFNFENLETKEFDPSNRQFNQSFYPLDYSKKVNFKSPYIKPCISTFYWPKSLNAYRKEGFNYKLFTYRYNFRFEELKNQTVPGKKTIVVDSCSILFNFDPWIQQSKHPYDIYSVLTQLYPDLYDFNVPATGISIQQAEAFSFWKAEQIRQEFAQKGLDYIVKVKVSSINELKTRNLCETNLPVPIKNKTPDWQITKEAYIEFWKSISDSILRECLYDKVINDQHALTLLEFDDFFFDETAREYIDIDPSDREVNRKYFPIDYYVKVKKYEKDLSCASCFDSINKSNELFFTYFFSDFKEANPKTGLAKTSKVITKIPNPSALICKSLEETITHYLSYDQALAFYNWKYPIWKFNSSSKWSDYVFPSEAEYEKVKNGEKVYLQFENIPFPSPLFHYTVQIYERK